VRKLNRRIHAMPGVWVVDVCGNLYRDDSYLYHVYASSLVIIPIRLCSWACNVSVNVSDTASEGASAASGVAQAEQGAGAPRQMSTSIHWAEGQALWIIKRALSRRTHHAGFRMCESIMRF
jgi:hypothetical protein